MILVLRCPQNPNVFETTKDFIFADSRTLSALSFVF